MQPWALVSPASRGIGLEFVRRLLQTTNVPVVATARKDLDQTKENVLSGLKDVKEDRLNVLKVDFLGALVPVVAEHRVPQLTPQLDEQSIHEAQQTAAELFPVKENYLHLGLCIPGILFPEKSPDQINQDDALMTFRINTIGPMLLTKYFWSFLPRKGAKVTETAGLPEQAVWANMSARVGSISDNKAQGGWFSYRSSKAAVNQLSKSFDNYLRMTADERAMCISMHPGTVKTGLSKGFWETVPKDKLFSVEYSVEKLMEMINSRTLEHRGRCWDYKSEEILP